MWGGGQQLHIRQSVVNDCLGRPGAKGFSSSAETQRKPLGSAVKGPPPLCSSSRLRKSSLLHRQFPLCCHLKGASASLRARRVALVNSLGFWSGWTHARSPVFLYLSEMKRSLQGLLVRGEGGGGQRDKHLTTT